MGAGYPFATDGFMTNASYPRFRGANARGGGAK